MALPILGHHSPHLDVRETDAHRQHLATPDRLFDSFMGGNAPRKGRPLHEDLMQKMEMGGEHQHNAGHK